MLMSHVSCMYYLLTEVWVLGDSIPRWAGVRATERGTPNLRMGTSIGWHAVGGLTWPRLRQTIELQVLLDEPPKVIVIHLGGNDLCNFTTTQIINNIHREMSYLREALPNTCIIWVDILDRCCWASELSKGAMRRKRSRIVVARRRPGQQGSTIFYE